MKKNAVKKTQERDWTNIFILLAASLLVKLIFAAKFEGHGTDMNCFYAWSEMIFKNGIHKFYYLDAFTDYPPGYMAVLWVIAAIRSLLSIDTISVAGRVLIKLVPILADIGTGFFLYRLASRRFSEPLSLLLCFSYVLNPVIVLDSSIWGQTDGVFTFFLFLTCYLCMEEKRIPAYFAFVVGVLMKPQMLIFTPILIFTIVEQVFLHDFNKQKMVRDLIGGLAALVAMFLFILPFGIEKVIPQYVDTLGSYQYCTVNAFNIWALFGKNWADQSGTFLFLQYRQWGTLAIFAAVILSGVVFFRLKESKSRYFLSMAVVVSTMFLFSVRMHERYLFPVIMLLLCGFILKPTKELFLTFVGFSVVQFMNVAYVLYYYVKFDSTGPTGGIIGITALLTLFFYGFMFYAIFHRQTIVKQQTKKQTKEKKKPVMSTVKMAPMQKKDWGLLIGIVVLYSAIALFYLGNQSAPETSWSAEEDSNEILLDLGSDQQIQMLHCFLGNYENRTFTLDVSEDGISSERIGTVQASSVFSWNAMKVEDSEYDSYNLVKQYRYIKLTANDMQSVLNELVVIGADGQPILPANADSYSALFDEQDDYEAIPTYMSGTYFDEIYHARTAYEMTKNLYCYENTHPPLGKILISVGIRIFGMNPFGWRIVGTVFGILMLPLIYFFARRLFRGKTWACGIATFLFAFDFMHFTQTRIATIDVYGTFFIIAMFFFMYWYSQMSFYDTSLWKTLIPLGLSAIMMGLGCASKWTGVYAAAGLGVFFFAIMIRRYREYCYAKSNISGSTEGISHADMVDGYAKNMIVTLVFCVLFFVVIAGGIYLMSYIPFVNVKGMSLWERMIQNQKDMFQYHSTLVATHPYSSRWYEWPFMFRPVFYYCQTLANGLKEGISAFGNPLVWWMGVPAFIYMVIRLVEKKDGKAGFLVFAYLVQYVPWIRVERCTFAYHYFPSVPFVTLMIVYAMVCLVEKDKKWLKWCIVYAACAFALFALFYPVLSGYPVTESFVRDGLRWLSGWVLIY